MSTAEEFTIAFRSFLESCTGEYCFPAGGEIRILTGQEVVMLNRLLDDEIDSDKKLELMQDELDCYSSYSAAILAVRLAVLGVRETRVDLLTTAILPLLASAKELDWRDLLRAISVVDDCATRLQLRIEDLVSCTVDTDGLTEKYPTLVGYTRRSSEMRSIDTMGIVETEIDGEFSYESR